MLSVIIFLPILAWNVAWVVLQVMQILFGGVRAKAVNNAVVGALGSFMVLILRINVLPPPLALCHPRAEPQFVCDSLRFSQHTFRTVGLCRKSF